MLCLVEGGNAARFFGTLFLEIAPLFFQSSALLRCFLGGFSSTNFG